MGAGADGRADTAVEFKGVVADTDKANAPVYLKIHGKVVDVTEFKKRHPGGKHLIHHYRNSDATDAYDNFHFGSKKADAFLKSLPVVEQTEGMIAPYKVYGEVDDNEEMLQDYRKWRQSLIDRGFFEPSVLHSAYRVLEVFAIFALGAFCFVNHYLGCGIVAWGLFGARCGWIQHECLHGSFVKSKRLGKMLGNFFIGFGLSTSGTRWNFTHSLHHSSTNKETVDMDLDTTPMVAFYKGAVEKNSRVGTDKFSPTWLKYQTYTFIPITSGWMVMLLWILYLHPRDVIRKGLYEEAFWMALSHVVKTGIISFGTGYNLFASYGVFWLCNWVAGVYLFSQFSLSHTFLPTVDANDFPTWFDYAVYHTVDQDVQSPLICWVQGYLNVQTVHHLYTFMPQFRQPIVSKELEVFAKKWNRPYQHITYFEAWKRLFANLDEVGKHYYMDAMELLKKED